MRLDDSAVRLIDMKAYTYQSKLTNTAIWLAEQDAREYVTTNDVIVAAEVLSDSKWEEARDG